MAREIAKAYDPKQIEPRWAEFWVKEELFKADANGAGTGVFDRDTAAERDRDAAHRAHAGPHGN